MQHFFSTRGAMARVVVVFLSHPPGQNYMLLLETTSVRRTVQSDATVECSLFNKHNKYCSLLGAGFLAGSCPSFRRSSGCRTKSEMLLA